MTKMFAGTKTYGWYAYVEDHELVIGENHPREGGELYRGEYLGDSTPYLCDIKEENVKLYNSITKYFAEDKNNHENAIMSCGAMTDMEKLRGVFSLNKEDVKKRFPQLYYAILAVLDSEKKPDANNYFKT